MKGLKVHLAWQTLCYFNKPAAEAHGERMKIEREAARTWFLQMYRVKSSVKAPSDPCLLTSGSLRSARGPDWYLDDVVVAATGFCLFLLRELKKKKILIFKGIGICTDFSFFSWLGGRSKISHQWPFGLQSWVSLQSIEPKGKKRICTQSDWTMAKTQKTLQCRPGKWFYLFESAFVGKERKMEPRAVRALSALNPLSEAHFLLCKHC